MQLDLDIGYEEIPEEWYKYNGKYVIVEGRFNMFNINQPYGYSGSISNISRYELSVTEYEDFNKH